MPKNARISKPKIAIKPSSVACASALVEAHGGVAFVTSNVGPGAECAVRLTGAG